MADFSELGFATMNPPEYLINLHVYMDNLYLKRFFPFESTYMNTGNRIRPGEPLDPPFRSRLLDHG